MGFDFVDESGFSESDFFTAAQFSGDYPLADRGAGGFQRYCRFLNECMAAGFRRSSRLVEDDIRDRLERRGKLHSREIGLILQSGGYRQLMDTYARSIYTCYFAYTYSKRGLLRHKRYADSAYTTERIRDTNARLTKHLETHFREREVQVELKNGIVQLIVGDAVQGAEAILGHETVYSFTGTDPESVMLQVMGRNGYAG